MSSSNIVRIFPRRKCGENSGAEKGRAPLKFDVKSIQPLFVLPQKDAARALGISLTALKKVCRKLGINSWVQVRDMRPPVAPTSAGLCNVENMKTKQKQTPGQCSHGEHDMLDKTAITSKASGQRSLEVFVQATLNDNMEMGSPIPDCFESDSMRDSASPDSDSSAETVEDEVRMRVDGSPTPSESADARMAEDMFECSDDLAYLVPLPSIVDIPAGEPYSSKWLVWYEESAKSFELEEINREF